MTPEQKRKLSAALRELADRIDADPGHVVGRDCQFEASLKSAAVPTQCVSIKIWFIRAARLARAGELLFGP